MSVLVVGAGGYLGGTIERMAHGDGRSVSCWRSSREDATAWLARIAAGDFSAVINTAAAKYRAPEIGELPRYLTSNVELPYRLGEAASAGGAVVIHVGTRWSLGERGEGPNSLYAATKAFGEGLLTAKWNHHGSVPGSQPVAVVLVRDLIGPHDPRSSLPRLLATASQQGRALPMTGGDQLMDPLDVRDVECALLEASERYAGGSRPETYSEVAVKPITVRQFVSDWQDATRRRVNVLWGALPYRGLELFAIEQVHPGLPGFVARSRDETYRATLLD